MSIESLVARLSEPLRTLALAHGAWTTEHVDSYERLEFLGDAVLGAAVAAELYRRFPDAPEGRMSQIKAATVSRESCAAVARAERLADLFILHAPVDIDASLVRDLSETPSVLADLVESIIGAAFLELGYDTTAAATVAAFAERLEYALAHSHDHKSALQEMVQRSGGVVSYELANASGPDHEPTFTARAIVRGSDADGASSLGSGRSKKVAEQSAAKELLQRLRDEAS